MKKVLVTVSLSECSLLAFAQAEFDALRLSQTDIAGTLLSQLEIDKKQFHWSKNLLSPYSPQFAYYAFEEGVGWIRPYGYFVYDKKSNQYLFMQSDEAHKNQMIKEGKSYIQSVFQEYMNY